MVGPVADALFRRPDLKIVLLVKFSYQDLDVGSFINMASLEGHSNWFKDIPSGQKPSSHGPEEQIGLFP